MRVRVRAVPVRLGGDGWGWGWGWDRGIRMVGVPGPGPGDCPGNRCASGPLLKLVRGTVAVLLVELLQAATIDRLTNDQGACKCPWTWKLR